MMLYHYSTWRGAEILKDDMIKPRNIYQAWTGNCILTMWPRLVFLTSDPRWEPSVQAMTKERQWEKCGSCPEVYTQMGIPCWRFEVKIPANMIAFARMAVECGDLWKQMVLDASELGSNPNQWVITANPVKIKDAWKWEDDKWERKR